MNHLIDTWFQLKDQMPPAEATALRPPSLRDACYASALAMRSKHDCDPETIEAYVNGLELGAMHALREAWNERPR